MACGTCGATMHNIGTNERADNFFLCPRCGTVLVDAFGQHGDKVYVPDLVKRCREFEKIMIRLTEDGSPTAEGRKDIIKYLITDHWHRLGLAEAIHMPSERKL